MILSRVEYLVELPMQSGVRATQKYRRRRRRCLAHGTIDTFNSVTLSLCRTLP